MICPPCHGAGFTPRGDCWPCRGLGTVPDTDRKAGPAKARQALEAAHARLRERATTPTVEEAPDGMG